MPVNPLFEVPFFIAVGMLASMFASALAPMIVLPRYFPVLFDDAHSKSRWLDGLRGLAAVTVAMNHAPLVIINLQLIPKVFFFSEGDFSLFRFFGSLGVQLFFCITGLLFFDKLLNMSFIDWNEFFRRRLRRIVPGYFFACFLAILIALWYSGFSGVGFIDLMAALPSLFSFGLTSLPKIGLFDFARLLGVNWSLAIEWRFYLVLPVIFVLLQKSRRVMLFGVLAFAALDVYLTNSSSWVYFISGALSVPLMHAQFSRYVRLFAAISILVLLMLLGVFCGKVPDYGWLRWLLMTGLFACLAISKPVSISARPLVSMGSISYSFYLLHSMVLFFVFEVCNRYFFDITSLSVRSFCYLSGFVLALASVVATLSYVIIERPFMRRLVRPVQN